MKPTAAELRILERARGQQPHDARPAPAPLALTMPVRRPVQVPLFGGPIALGQPSAPSAPAARVLRLVAP